MSSPDKERSRALELGAEISQGPVADFYRRYIAVVGSLHPQIESSASGVEARFFFERQLLCRVVPYRELFHVQIGDDNAWETRVRNEAGFLDAVDRTVQRFLQVYAGPTASGTRHAPE